ncbi:unnamed protein product [Prunus armeniaca]
MVDTRRTKSNATTTGPSHGFVVETSMQQHGIMPANALQPSSSALQPPSAAGIAEQPPHDPGTSTALQSPAPITGVALPRCPAVGAQQQPHHLTTRLAAQPHGYYDIVPVLEQIHSLPPIQVDLNSRVDQLTQKVDDQNNLIGQLLRQINLNQGPNLGPRDEERRAHEYAGEQFERSQASQTRANRQGRERDRADETQTAASRTLSRSRLGPRTNVLERLGPQSNVRARLGPQGARGNQGDRPLGAGEEVSQSRSRHRRRRPERPFLRAEDDDQRLPARSRFDTRRQAVEGSSQAQSPNLPHGQSTQGDRPLGVGEEVSQSRSRHRRRRPERPSLRAEDDDQRLPASRTLSRSRLGPRTNVLERLGPHSNVRARLGPQGARVRERSRRQAVEGSSQTQPSLLPHRQGNQGDRPLGAGEKVSQSCWRHRRSRRERPSLRAEGDDRRPPARSRTNTRRQVAEESSQAQSPNLPHGQSTQGDRPLGTEDEVSQSHSRHRRRRPETPTLRAEDVAKLVNDQLRGLRLKGSTEEALCKEIDRVDCSPFTDEVERAPPPKRFTTSSITPFKGDSDPKSHLRHFKSAMILYKADDALMCKVFAMTLRGATQDWFHTLPSASIGNFKKFVIIFTKKYTSYKTVRKHADHLFNLRKKLDESLRDYLRRFKAEKANIIGCNDQVASSAFKKGLPTEHELYRELAITPNQTLAEVFATADRYALWDDDRIATKKASKQVDHPTKQASQKSYKFEQKARDKGRSRLQEGSLETGTFTEFAIPIYQILAQVKDKPWVRRPPPMKGDPSKRDTSKYCAFHGEHGHYTNNCNAWKRHLEELVREGYCTEFVAKKAIQQIEDRDAAA